MKIRSIFSIFIVFTVIASTGCGKAKDSDSVIASIGNTKITVADFNERIANLPERYRDIAQTRKDEYLQELINDTLLYQEAKRKGLEKDKEVQKVIEEARRKILISRLLKDEVNDATSVSEEEIQALYTSNSDKYMTPEIMRVSHILLQNKEDADAILRDLKGGADFEETARGKSMDPTAQRGGDIGYFPKGQLMPEFENACALLEVDEISGVTKTQLGYHIIKLTERRPPQLRPLDEVKETIVLQVHAIKRRKIFSDLLERLRDGTVVKINDTVLSEIDDQKDQEQKEE